MLRLLLTGGGTAGHVIPQVGLIEYIQTVNPQAILGYVGSKDGIEKKLIAAFPIPYYSITVGKWRRYLSWRNLLVPFQVIFGLGQSICICRRFKPTVIFSKGGFVALPVVIAGWCLGIPIVVHESDVIPGLANRLSFPLSRRICYSFNVPSPSRYRNKTKVTGLPMRRSLAVGNQQQGLKLLGFHLQKPILLIWGGSLGAATINTSIYRLLPRLTLSFQVVHLCGPHKKLNDKQVMIAGYRLFEYLETITLSHVLACADLVISRAGATAIYELLVLHKPHILCPLSTQASRGEQIRNAEYLESLGLSAVIYPDTFHDDVLFDTVNRCYRHLPQWKEKITRFNLKPGTQKVYKELLHYQ